MCISPNKKSTDLICIMGMDCGQLCFLKSESFHNKFSISLSIPHISVKLKYKAEVVYDTIGNYNQN